MDIGGIVSTGGYVTIVSSENGYFILQFLRFSHRDLKTVDYNQQRYIQYIQ